jgi:AcrR family transcriptional regulator
MTRREATPARNATNSPDGAGGESPTPASTDRIKRDTGARIIEAAAEAAARFGVNRWTIDDVSACAGISRRTVYRYFPTRDDLVDALAGHEKREFEQNLKDVVRKASEPADRFDLVIDYVFGFAQNHPVLQRMLETEPEYVIQYLQSTHVQFLAAIEAAISPSLEGFRLIREGTVTSTQLTELIVHIGISTYITPDTDIAEVSQSVKNLYRSLR